MNFTDLPEVLLAAHRTLAVTAGSTRCSAVWQWAFTPTLRVRDTHQQSVGRGPISAGEFARRHAAAFMPT